MVKKLLPLLILVIAVAAAFGLIQSKPPADQSEVVPPTILVEVLEVRAEDAYLSVASQGTVEPRTRTTLISEVAGRVIEVSPDFVAGGFFRQGDILLRLDDQDYRAAVRRAEAAVATARSQLAQERGQADVAQREWERMSPEQQAQVRASELYLRQPQLEQATAQLASAEADLLQARSDLSRTAITAPYDGLISSRNTDMGQFVTTGTTIGEIFAVDYAEVRLPIPENRLQYLDLPTLREAGENGSGKAPAVELVSRIGGEEYHWLGRLTRTEGVLDTRTRVLFSVVQVEDPYGLYGESRNPPLRIGTYVNASIRGKLFRDVVVLPRHTLQSNSTVWVADPENRLRARQVDVVTENGDSVFVAGGLQSGDRVVLTRLENPLNGMAVQTRALPSVTIQ